METSLIAMCIFLIAQLIAGVWWAATINTKMDFMLDITHNFKDIPNTYSTKEEVRIALAVAEKNIAAALTISDKNIAGALAIADKNILAMWKQIDAKKEIT